MGKSKVFFLKQDLKKNNNKNKIYPILRLLDFDSSSFKNMFTADICTFAGLRLFFLLTQFSIVPGRYHKIGMLVLFVHDITDIFLEFTKCNVYMKNRGGKYYAIHDYISTIGFLVFAAAW